MKVQDALQYEDKIVRVTLAVPVDGRTLEGKALIAAKGAAVKTSTVTGLFTLEGAGNCFGRCEDTRFPLGIVKRIVEVK